MATIVKVIEVIARSEKGFDDAVRSAVAETARTVKGIRSVWVDNLTAEVEGSTVTSFRANVKISFLVEGRA
jgi:dodecin